MTAGNQKALRQQCLDNQWADMLSRYPTMDLDLMLALHGEDPCFAALAPVMPELLPLLVVDPPAALEKMREHVKISRKKPKTQRGRGRPKGSKTDTTSTKAEVDLWGQGFTDPEIFGRLKPSHEFDGGRARRAKIYTFSLEKQASICAAHKAGKQARKQARTQALRQAALEKRLRKKESGS